VFPAPVSPAIVPREAAMFFRIENVGPLREAEVDLSKRLIVLTGPNNTGKTYLAWSVYGLYKSMPKAGTKLFDPCIDALLSSERHEVDLGDFLREHHQDLLSIVATTFAENIHRCFATERANFEGASVVLHASEPDEAINRLRREPDWSIFGPFGQASDEYVVLNQRQGATQLTFSLVNRQKLADMGADGLVDAASGGLLIEDTTTRLATMPLADRASLRSRLSRMILHFIRPAMFERCEIFPAERIAVNIFAKELAATRSKLVDELVDADIDGQRMVPMDFIRRNTGRYPWPIRDSLDVANDLSRMSRQESPFADLAAELEGAVLGGKISISSDGEMSYAPQGAPERNLGVHLTASVVKSLSSLVFYFRHLAKSNDFIIIDEPELNLHPDSQRKLARILAKAVKRGFKLMMSTHSDYIIRELNHMIMLSKLSPEAARELGYDPECALAPDDVGVYLFNDHTCAFG
jgi:energy-coupling factor transporter ATP-binding protein EcfA2